jgi:hypothetical protein
VSARPVPLSSGSTCNVDMASEGFSAFLPNGTHSSAVSIATRYELDGPGIESQWGARYSAPVQTGPAGHPISYKMGADSFPWVKRPELGVDHPSPTSAEVKERVELYLYSPSGPSWPVIG